MTRSHVTTVDEPVARREFRSAPLSVSLCMFGSLRVCTLGSAVELASETTCVCVARSASLEDSTCGDVRRRRRPR